MNGDSKAKNSISHPLSLSAGRASKSVPRARCRWWRCCKKQLIEKEAGNFQLPSFPGLIVKESYRRWPNRNLAGNTIDFFVQVLGMSFHDALRQIIES